MANDPTPPTPQFPAVAQITVSCQAFFHQVRLVFHALQNETILQIFHLFYGSKKCVYFIKSKISVYIAI